jgi:hypothetical protein
VPEAASAAAPASNHSAFPMQISYVQSSLDCFLSFTDPGRQGPVSLLPRTWVNLGMNQADNRPRIYIDTRLTITPSFRLHGRDHQTLICRTTPRPNVTPACYTSQGFISCLLPHTSRNCSRTQHHLPRFLIPEQPAENDCYVSPGQDVFA